MARVPYAVAMTALVIVLVGCDDTIDSVAPDAPPPDADLLFTLPELGPELFVRRSTAPPGEAQHDGPMGTSIEPGIEELELLGELSEEDIPETATAAAIYDAWTDAGFYGTGAYAQGTHKYQANTARLETTATVSMGYEELGSQTAYESAYVPMLVSFGLLRQIWATAEVSVLDDCGLRVTGRSRHGAGWQWFLGTTAEDWGETATTTFAGSVSQPPCEEQQETVSQLGLGDSETEEAIALCFFLLEHDLETGEIYDIDFLFCASLEGGYVEYF